MRRGLSLSSDQEAKENNNVVANKRVGLIFKSVSLIGETERTDRSTILYKLVLTIVHTGPVHWGFVVLN
jgi:hypothetical protein